MQALGLLLGPTFLGLPKIDMIQGSILRQSNRRSLSQTELQLSPVDLSC